MSDGIDIGDFPVPPNEAETVRVADTFDYNVAFKLGLIGVGQCGGRVAATFQQLGYGRVCAINTTIQDLAELRLPDDHKLDIGDARGAGKDPAAAAALFEGRDEDIFDLLKRSWGEEVDYGMVCLAAAGGTGAGGCPKVIEVVKRYMAHCKRPVKVGVIVALPRDDEGQRFAKNAVYTVRSLAKLGLSPVIIIDNQKIRELYPSLSASQVHPMENKSTATLLHLFNRLAGSDSTHTTFDRADFAKLLDSGLITFAADTLHKWQCAADITTPIRERLRRNVLASVDFSKSTVAGLIYILTGAAYDEARSADLDHGTAMFTRMLADGSTVFPGVYQGGGANAQATIKVMAMIGALPWPAARLRDLAERAGESPDELEKALGV